jgi:TPR repeat protein
VGLALLYKAGAGVSRDDSYAAELFRRACDQGEGMACYSLGYMYAHGEGVDVDLDQAAKLFRAACDGGDRTGCRAAEQVGE